MLPMTSVTVDYMFKMSFFTSYVLQAGPQTSQDLG